MGHIIPAGTGFPLHRKLKIHSPAPEPVVVHKTESGSEGSGAAEKKPEMSPGALGMESLGL